MVVGSCQVHMVYIVLVYVFVPVNVLVVNLGLVGGGDSVMGTVTLRSASIFCEKRGAVLFSSSSSSRTSNSRSECASFEYGNDKRLVGSEA